MPSASVYTDEYTLYPRIVPAGWSGEVVLGGEYAHTHFQPGREYSYQLQSVFFSAVTPRRKGSITGTATPGDDGTLTIPFAPDVPGEWQLTVDSEQVRSRHLPCRAGLFVQTEKWLGYRPYLGELHCHSTGSDGAQEPAYVPVRARSYGMDFLALTDHRNFHSALEMKQRIGGMLGRRMVLMAGEEMHPEVADISPETGAPVHSHYYHYVAVGQQQSVRDRCLADPAAAAQAIDGIEAELRGRGVSAELDVRGYAEGVWKVRTARALGATTLLCHPYWGGKPINLDMASIEQSLYDREAHAVEAMSRADLSNYMANRLIELAADGVRWPMVGVSDGHNWDAAQPFSFGTLVMAESLDQASILAAVRDNRSVACALGSPNQFLGPFELIPFATFYCTTLLPLKRKRAALQAELVFSALRGSAFDQGTVDALDDELEAMERQLWASA